MEHFVVTIARQYGSGGRQLGEMLAKRHGIPYYDRNIIQMASDDSGINSELFGRVDEYTSAKPPIFGRTGVYTGDLIPPDDRDFLSDENLFNYQAKIIRELAERGSCVIIGRCANYVLKDYDYVLRVFIHASWDYRMKRAAEKMSMSERELEKFLRKDDKRKMDYCLRFTGKEWFDATQYDLCLDSSKFELERCVEEIESHLHL